MIKRPNDLLPASVAEELLRLAKLDRDWMVWSWTGPDSYKAKVRQQTWLKSTMSTAADYFAMWAGSMWLVDGPKIFRPTIEQCNALEQVEVNIHLSDYSQPYPCILIDLPDNKYSPFTGILCHIAGDILTLVSNSKGNEDDITTTIAVDNRPIEKSLQTYDEGLIQLGKICGKALRVAVNSCLLLSNFGHKEEFIFPKEVERDERLSREKNPRGELARRRLVEQPKQLILDREVILHHVEGGKERGEPTDREVSPHWRRGHWRMQNFGPHNSLRKRIFVKPVFVRSDLFVGEHSETTTTYRE